MFNVYHSMESILVGNGDNTEKLAYLIKKDIIIKHALKVDKY